MTEDSSGSDDDDIERRRTTAATLRKFSEVFHIPESQVVTIQKHGGKPVEIELGDLLKRIERKDQQPKS